MRIYLVGPITGKGYDEVMERITGLAEMLTDLDYDVMHPMLGKGKLRNEVEFSATGTHHPVATDHAIYGRDRWCVEMSDIILADFTDAERVSIGSCFELAWATAYGKHVVLVMEPDNIHQHAFVKEAAHVIFETMEEAVEYLSELAQFDVLRIF